MGTVRSQSPHAGAPPNRRQCFAIGGKVLALCHADDEDGPLMPVNEMRTLDLSKFGDIIPGWQVLVLDPSMRPPNAVQGYAAAVWEERDSVLFSGGVDGNGMCVSDVWILTLSSNVASWKALAEWPSSIFSGEGAKECHPEVRSRTSQTPPYSTLLSTCRFL